MGNHESYPPAEEPDAVPPEGAASEELLNEAVARHPSSRVKPSSSQKEETPVQPPEPPVSPDGSNVVRLRPKPED